VTVVKLRRNFGQTAGSPRVFDHARGETSLRWTATCSMDPSDIPVFIEKIAEGYDIVSGWRQAAYRQSVAASHSFPALRTG